MKLLCPACRGSLPDGAGPVVTCGGCAAEVDLTRASTAAGRPRFVPELDRAGAEVGGLRLEGRLGAGGMGTVYRARDRGGLPLAVKFLAPALAGDAALVARFRREVKLLAALDHPGIVRVLADGEEAGVPWFAMELVEGPDLRARLRSGTLAPAEVEAVFLRLLEALAHAHARGVVHRDLKPANVLLAPDGARLADFGIAHLDGAERAGSPAATRLTESAAVLGTLAYMSPEQRRGEPVDRRSDLFSVGVMLYEAITGSLPQGAFPPASRENRTFPAAIDGVVARLLQPRPDDRFGDAGQAATALARALRRRVRRRVLAAVGGAAAAIGAFALTLGIPAATRRKAEQAAEQVMSVQKEAAPPVLQMKLPAPVPAPAAQAVEPLPELKKNVAKARTPTKATKVSPKQKVAPPEEQASEIPEIGKLKQGDILKTEPPYRNVGLKKP